MAMSKVPRGDSRMTQRIEISAPGTTVMVGCIAAGIAVTFLTGKNLPLVLAILIGLFFLFSIKVVRQWEKVAVLRFGRVQRVRIGTVTAESTLTRDTVPVNVDAIVFWLVWNAEKSILEVANFEDAIAMSAQTALRESIGRHDLAKLITDRDALGQELQKILDAKTNPWGITVQSVEIRDVRIPQPLENAMSQQAQAERERHARIILGDAELQVAAKFAEASEVYLNKPGALHLRAMNMLYEAIKERGSMVIVPSSAVETMGLGGMLATTALNKTSEP